MNPNEDEIVKLIRLKRHERPPEGYFEDFVSEFQRRQRSELLRRSAHGIFFERVATYLSGYGRQSWMVGAGAAAAVTMSVVLFLPAGDDAIAGGGEPGGAEENVLWDIVPTSERLIPRSPTRILPVVSPPTGPVQLIPVTHEAPRDF